MIKSLLKTTITIAIIFSCIPGLAQVGDCERMANFGEMTFCLPEIPTYNESYLEPTVKAMADATEVAINSVLGFYLDDETYEKREQIGIITFDNYFKLYGTKEIKDFHATGTELTQMYEMLASSFKGAAWDEAMSEVDKLNLEIEIGVPNQLEKYRHTDDSFTYVLLIKYQVDENESFTMAGTVNGLLINNRIIWMAYYRLYTSPKVIEELKTRNNEIISAILDANQ